MPLRRATTETPLPGLEALVHHGQFLLDTPAATPLLAEHFDSLSLLVVINTVVSLSLMERGGNRVLCFKGSITASIGTLCPDPPTSSAA